MTIKNAKWQIPHKSRGAMNGVMEHPCVFTNLIALE